MGKSGHVAQKLASTLASTGSSAFYLHPSEALHGDFGMMGAGDVLIAITYAGETREVLAVVKFAKSLDLPVIAITGKASSSLARQAHHVLDAYVEQEADPLGMAPTASSTLALALGDALAVALMRKRKFTREHFLTLHPGGSLGRACSRVIDLMHPWSDELGVCETATLETVLAAMNATNFGIIAVLTSTHTLCGVISDGDIRRTLLTWGAQAFQKTTTSWMGKAPKIIAPQENALSAVNMMHHYKITSLYVADPLSKRPLGILRLHDLLTANVL
jgi:arabinose-5-phosphate isomerase